MSEIKKGSRVKVVSLEATENAGFGVVDEMELLKDNTFDVQYLDGDVDAAGVDGWTLHLDDLELVQE